MFEKFGEFDSAAELNNAAEGLLREGDCKSLMELAKENGIDEEDVQDYVDGMSEELASPLMAAYGRLRVEELAEQKKQENERSALSLIRSMVGMMCEEPQIAAAVMQKGKRTTEILSAMRKAAEKHKNGNCGMCCGTDKDLKNVIRAYYIGTEKELSEIIARLYER